GASLRRPSTTQFFFSSRRRHTRFSRDWSSDVCSSDLFLASAVLGAALTVLWAFRPVQPITAVYALAGVCSALAYATGLLLLLRTPLRAPLLSTLVPLGRTALTCYLSQTLVILAALPLLTADPTRLSVFALAAATVAAQAVLARWWLARFRYGPLEWVWRSLTWGRPVSNRIPPAPQGGSGRPGLKRPSNGRKREKRRARLCARSPSPTVPSPTSNAPATCSPTPHAATPGSRSCRRRRCAGSSDGSPSWPSRSTAPSSPGWRRRPAPTAYR